MRDHLDVGQRDMDHTLELASHGPVIPAIVIQHVADTVPLARALVDGAVRVLMATLRTPDALACIKAIAPGVPDAIVGAGTIRSAADARAARAGPFPDVAFCPTGSITRETAPHFLALANASRSAAAFC